MNIIWKTDHCTNETIFYADNIPVASVKVIPGCTDTFTREDENVLRWNRTTDTPVTKMEMAVETFFSAEHTMIPAVSYDGNPWGSDHEYKSYEWEGIPYTFAFHRCAVPGASCSMNSQVGLAFYCSQGEPCSCSLQPEKDYTVHRILWPETEGPRILHTQGRWEESFQGTMEARSSFTAYLCFGIGQSSAWKGMLHHAWQMNYCPMSPDLSPEETWRLGIAYAKLLYTEEADGFKAFSIGFTWNESQWVKRSDYKYELGWCGQNASFAVSLLYDYQMNGDHESLDMGLAVLQNWIQRARSADGFLLTRYDPPGCLIDACNLGGAGLQFFEAYDITKHLGCEKPEFMKTALEICRFAMERQRLDGGMGMSWNQDGTPHELKGTAGAFLILPLAEAFLRTKDPAYNVAAVRAFSYYYNEFKRNGYGTAGALDTYCIDKESVIPLLKGALLMYKCTGFTSYLKWAEEAAWYLSTWQWHHAVDYPKGSVLQKMHYNTFGGTAVSTSHHHIDSYALYYVNDLLELASLTKNPQWKERAIAIWCNGVQGISDGTTALMDKGPRPAGSQDEGYLHTRWGDPSKKDGYFSLSQWLVAWPGAFRLEVLRGDNNWNLFTERKGV